MNVPRLFLYSLVLLVLTLLAAGVHFYPRLPDLLEQQARVYLSDYGVSELEWGKLRFSATHLGSDHLRVAGEIDGLQFDITVYGISVSYAAGELWRGHIRSVAVARVEAVVAALPKQPQSAPAPVVLSELMPANLLPALPLNTLNVAQWQLDYRPLQGETLSANGGMQWDGELALPFEMQMPQVRASGQLRSGAQDALSVEVAVFAADIRLGRVEAGAAPQGNDRWHWALAGEVEFQPLLQWLRDMQVEGVPPPGQLALAGAAQFTADLDHPDEVWLPGPSVDFLAQFDGGLAAQATIASLAYSDVLEKGESQFESSIQLAEGAVEGTLRPLSFDARIATALLQLPEQARQWLRWGETVPLHWRGPGVARLSQTPEGGWQLQVADNRLLLGDKSSQVKLDALALEGTLEPGDTTLTSLALDTRLDIRLRQKQLPQLQLVLKQTGSITDSDFELRLGDTAQSLALSAHGELNATTGQGEFLVGLRSLDLPYAGSTLVPLLQKFDLLQQPLAFSSGSFELASEVRLDESDVDQLSQKASLDIQGVSGSYGDYPFEGIDASATWRGIDKWQTLQPAVVSIARLDLGFEVTDTRATLVLPRPTSLDRPLFRVEQFESKMFGGRVYLPEAARWDFSRDANSVTLRADDWRLGDIVALQTGQDIQADGTLEGELPVTVRGGRIIIDKGYLRARAPGGSIRYIANAASQALAASSPELGMAMGLLENFRYQTLSSEVALDPAGNLLLGLSLEGSSPDHYEGRTIRFNINLEQNLDPLLQSLRLSDSLVEKVEKGLR